MKLLRPADVCRDLLAALDASEGPRRKRDTTPDASDRTIKRDLLQRAVADDPDPDAFEGWLLERCLTTDGGPSVGAIRAMALDVLQEWRLATTSPEFRGWLDRGAPSDDRPSSAR